MTGLLNTVGHGQCGELQYINIAFSFEWWWGWGGDLISILYSSSPSLFAPQTLVGGERGSSSFICTLDSQSNCRTESLDMLIMDIGFMSDPLALR